MSMFHAARSASPIGCPNPTPGRAGRVHRPALDDRGLAVPAPAIAEARETLVEHRLLERRLLPVLAAVRGNIHGGDPAPARPGEPLDLVEPRSLELHAA